MEEVGAKDKVEKTQAVIVEEDSTVQDTLGERFLHIYLEETTGVSLGEESGTVDLVFEISAFGMKKYTKVINEVTKGSMTYWGHHFFFEKSFKTKADVENEVIEVRAYDHKRFGSNSYIGNFTFSQEAVYCMKDHTYMYRWFPIQNIEKNHQALFGFVKMSINVARPGDKRVRLDDEPALSKNKSENKSMGDIMLPPQIKIKKQQIEIRLIKAERVVKMDFAVIGTGTADPYAQFYFGGIEAKSKVCKDTLNPVWNQKIMIPS